MPRENYQERLNELRTDVVAMGDLVLDRYETALRAAETGDDDLADEVIGGDHVVNDRYLKLEEECTELLALQQPVAGDLRLVTASFKIITDLERVADLATNIAEYGGEDGGSTRLSTSAGLAMPPVRWSRTRSRPTRRPIPTPAGRSTPETTTSTSGVGEPARRSSGELEADRARIEANGAPEADSGHLADALDDVSRALLAIRDLERVGDHAVNIIAARTLFMIESDDELIY